VIPARLLTEPSMVETVTLPEMEAVEDCGSPPVRANPGIAKINSAKKTAVRNRNDADLAELLCFFNGTHLYEFVM